MAVCESGRQGLLLAPPTTMTRVGRLLSVMIGLVLSDVSAVDAPKVFGEAIQLEGCGTQAMALALEGDFLYAGCRSEMIVYDVTVPLKPKKVGSVRGFGEVRQLVARKGFVYVAARESGFWIVDATDPKAPRIRSRFDCCELATGIDVAGNVAFLGQRINGVEFIDVSDPDHPAHIAIRKTDESQSVKYRDGYLYSGEWGVGRVTVFDVRDMRNIRQVAIEPLWGYGDGVWMKGKYLYVATGHHAKNRAPSTLTYPPFETREVRADGTTGRGYGCGHGLDIFDITDPTKPQRVGRVDYPPFFARAFDMWTPRTSGKEGVLFAAQTHNGVFAVDVSDPAKPKVLERWTFPDARHPDYPSCCIGSIAVGNGCLYVAGKGCGVVALPTGLAVREEFDQGILPQQCAYREPYPTDGGRFYVWKPSRPGQARALALEGDVVYAACGDAGLHVLRILPEGGLEEIGALPGVPGIFDVQTDGKRLYTAEGLGGWAIYEIEGPTKFREVARRARLEPNDEDPALLIGRPRPGLLALSTRRNGVSLFREEDFATGEELLRVTGCPGWDKYLMDVPIGGGRWLGFNAAYTALCWIDLDAPKGPEAFYSGRTNSLSMLNGLCRFDENRAFVTRGLEWFFLEGGRTDPADGSRWPARVLPGEGVRGIPRCSGDGLVALTSRAYGQVGVWDFRDPANPRQLHYWELSGKPDLAVFHQGKVLIPAGHQGVLLQK